MISLPNQKSILQKIAEFRIQYIKEHNKVPDVIYLDPDERKDLRKAVGLDKWYWPITISGMKLRKQEEYCEHLILKDMYCLQCTLKSRGI